MRRRRPVFLLVGVSVFGSLLVRCAAFEPADDNANKSSVDANDGDRESDSVSPNGADAAAPLTDGSDGAEDGATSSGCDESCVGTGGPCQVKVGNAFCIDSTEVTIGQFREFTVSADGGAKDAGGFPCPSTKVAVIGSAANENLPMTQVTFCEARAFCKWAGKRLCGRVGGEALPSTENATQSSSWFNACTGGSGTALHTVDDGGGCQLATTASRPVGGPGCEGSVKGLFDMVGNVFEWIDEPIDSGGGVTTAAFMGGSYLHTASTLCTFTSAGSLNLRSVDLGFRCCSNP